jgi:hypothetical protein
MTKAEARRAAEAFLDAELRVRFSHEILIIEDGVEDRGDAWIFPYNGRGYLERGDITEIITGNAPIAVDKETGSVGFRS